MLSKEKVSCCSVKGANLFEEIKRQVEKSLLRLLSDDELEKESSQSSDILDDDTLKHKTVSSSGSSIECNEQESYVDLQLQPSNKKFKLETTGNKEKTASRSPKNKSSRRQFENKDATKQKVSFTPEEDENLHKGSK